MKKDDKKLHQLLNEANQAKDRLYNLSLTLEEHGYIRKAKSCMQLVYDIEAWQNRN